MFSLWKDDHLRVAVQAPLPQKEWRLDLGRSQERTTSGSSLGSLRITVVQTLPRNQIPRVPLSFSTPQVVELPQELAGPSERSIPAISFGAPSGNRILITASESEPELFGEEVSAVLPPSRMVAKPELDPEMMAVLSWATERVGFEWRQTPLHVPSP